jgi:hypothetical protein
MNTQPPRRSDRTTWIDPEGTAWRVERTADLRWQLSRYRPAVEAWIRIGSWPSRGEAIQAAAEHDELW